jgi:hypothetical protein
MSSPSFDLTQIRSLVQNYFSSEPQALAPILAELADGLLQGRAQAIRDLVETLGPQLTATDTPTRVKGMSLLASVVSRLAEKISLPLTSAPGTGAGSVESEVVVTFAEFFLMRLDDETTMIESTEALHALVSSGRMSQRLCELILKKLFCDVSVHLQSSPQLVRRGAYWVLKCMLEDETGGGNSAIRKLGETLVAGFIGAMDAEKEPRNLLIALLIFPRLVWTVPQHVTHQEDLFEISSCYFPISFSERADDANAIRKASLTRALRHTMCTGTEFWIPFLMEKLASSLIETKLEVLHSLHHALSWHISLSNSSSAPAVSFSVHTPLSSAAIEGLFKPFKITQLGTLFWRFEQVQPFVVALTNALIKEIINTTDEQVAENATGVLTDLSRFLQFSANGATTSLPSTESRLKALHCVTDAVFKQCLPYLNLLDAARSGSHSTVKSATPDSKLAAMAAKIVNAVTCGSVEAAEIIFKRIIPLLEAKWLSDPSERSFVLRQLLNLAQASAVFHGPESTPNGEGETAASEHHGAVNSNHMDLTLVASSTHPLAEYAEPILRIMLSCCMETASYAQDQADAMEGIAVISTISKGILVSPSMLTQCLTALYSKLLEHTRATSTSDAAVGLKLAALKALAKCHVPHASFVLQHKALQPLWDTLHARLASIRETAQESAYNDLIELVAAMHLLCDPSALAPPSDQPQPTQVLVSSPSITAAIQDELIKALTSHCDDSRIFSILLSSLSRTASSTLHYQLVLDLIQTHLSKHPQIDAAWREAVQKWFPLLVQQVASSALHTPEKQRSFLETLYDSFMPSPVSVSERTAELCFPVLCALVITLPIQNLIDTKDTDANEKAGSLVQRLLALLQHLVAPFLQPGPIEVSYGESASLSSIGKNPMQPQLAVTRSKQEWYLDAIGSLLNKMPSPLPSLDTFIQTSLLDGVLKQVEDSEVATGRVNLICVAAKALVQRNHAKSMVMVSALIGLLKEGKTREVKQVVAQQMRFLLEPRSVAQPFANPLYKQKVWQLFLPALKNEYVRAEAEQQAIYMQAASGMLHHLPRGVLLQSAPALLPLLLTALTRYGESVCDQAVASIYNMLHASEKDVLGLLEPHLVSVVKPLVHIAASAAPKPRSNHTAQQVSQQMEKTSETKAPSHAPASTRLQAIECLHIILRIPYAKIVPWRNVVVDGLQPALDDPKRAIRRQAVVTRNEWYMVGKLKP